VYRWIDHTAELELEIEAASAEEVLGDALAAFRELVRGDETATGERSERALEVSAPDRAALLAEWLEELIYLAETEGFVPEQLASLELGEGRARGLVQGRRGSPPDLVKAATYHGLRFEREGEVWRAGAVLDV
jgi:SHS2 domain-containing protein